MAAATAEQHKGPVMRADLSFGDATLERGFRELHALRNEKLERQFHFARALTWLAILLRVLPGGKDWRGAAILAAGTLTTLAPAFLHHLPQRQYLRLRLPVQIADNVLQVALGCYTHSIIYRTVGDQPSAFQAAAVLLTGNGVAWLLFCSLWGSLPFKYALPQQAALTIILLLYSRPMCASNTAIQMAYAALCGSLSRRASLVLGRLIQISSWSQLSRYYAAGRSCAAAVLAAPPQAREAVRAACLASAEAIADAAVVLEAEAAGQATNSAELCMRWQPLSLIVLGFLGPTFYIFSTELRMRRALLQQRQNAGVPALRLPSPVHLPGLMEYCSFSVPAVAAMWSFVCA